MFFSDLWDLNWGRFWRVEKSWKLVIFFWVECMACLKFYNIAKVVTHLWQSNALPTRPSASPYLININLGDCTPLRRRTPTWLTLIYNISFWKKVCRILPFFSFRIGTIRTICNIWKQRGHVNIQNVHTRQSILFFT